MNTYIKLFRCMQNWEWYQEPNVFKVFCDLLLQAQFKETEYKGIKLHQGQLTTSIQALAERNGLTPQKVKTALEKLESTGEITKKTTNKFTLITVENYTKYQCYEQDSNKQNNKQITNKQQTNNKQITTYNKDNKVNKENNVNNTTTTKNNNSSGGEDEEHTDIWNALTGEQVDLLCKMYYDANGLIDTVADQVRLENKIIDNPIGYILGYAKNRNWERKLF